MPTDHPNPFMPVSGATGQPGLRAKKPIAMWIMQIVAITSLPVSLLYALLFAAYSLDQAEREGWPGGIIFALVLLLVCIPWAIAILITAAKRKAVVRWLGGGVIGLFVLAWLCWLLGDLGGNMVDGRLQMGRIISETIIVVLGCYWLYAFAFSAKAKLYLGIH